MTQPGNPVLSNNDRAVEPDELTGVKPLFKGGDCFVKQIAPSTDMQAHIIALGVNFFNVCGGYPDQF